MNFEPSPEHSMIRSTATELANQLGSVDECPRDHEHLLLAAAGVAGLQIEDLLQLREVLEGDLIVLLFEAEPPAVSVEPTPEVLLNAQLCTLK